MSIIYEDRLVKIEENRILFKNYSFFKKPKTVLFSDIKSIKIRKMSFWNGKYRIHGTGNFKTWFPFDEKRPWRKSVYILRKKNSWWNIGFTVEDKNKVSEIFNKKGLL